MKNTIEILVTIDTDQLAAISGGHGRHRFVARHPVAAARWFAKHPGAEARFAANHPVASTRIDAIQRRRGW